MKRKANAEPCKGCPFRSDSMPGWLGANSPEEMTSAILWHENELPCHSSIDYARADWQEKWLAGKIGKRCVGSLIMARRHAKLMRDPDYAAAVKAADRAAEGVFTNLRDFIAYHNSSNIKSWSPQFEERNRSVSRKAKQGDS